MVFALLTGYTAIPTFAATIVTNKNYITPDTIVTADNAYDVLAYLHIDKSNIVKINSNYSRQNDLTVQDLEKAIKKAKDHPKYINDKSNISSTSNALNSFTRANSVGTVMLYYDVNCDGYIVSYEVAGNYSGKKWVGASSASVSVDGNGDTGPISYEIGSKNLRLSYTSSLITLNAKVVVETYAGIGPLKVKIASQTVTSYKTWNTSYI